MDSNAVLAQLLAAQKKTLLHARIRTVLTLLIAAALIGGYLTVVPAWRASTEELEKNAASLAADTRELRDEVAAQKSAVSRALAAVDTESLAALTEQAGKTLRDVADAMGTVADLDADAINALVETASKELPAFSDALERVSKIDPDEINHFLSKLDEVMEAVDKLNRVAESLGKITSIFGR